MKKNDSYLTDYAALCRDADKINLNVFDELGVQRGLRDKNGNGVRAGLTNISRIESFQMKDGQKIPCEGKLWYRGYNCIDLVKGLHKERFGFEEIAYLLLFGNLPDRKSVV